MLNLSFPALPAQLGNAPTSALVLADRLLTLAQTADRAGYIASASHLVQLALSVFDEQPHCAAQPLAH
jgi:hypothetical protein